MATSGMDVLQVQMEGVANNIANVSTPGYKKDSYLMKTFPEMLMIERGGPEQRLGHWRYKTNHAVGISGIGAQISEVKVDFSMGNIYETGDKTDILLNGPAYFAVEYPGGDDPGRIHYTRNGAMRVDENGYLVTSSGYRVQGDRGGIYLGDGELRFNVEIDGTIFLDDEPIDRIKLFEFDNEDASLKKLTDDLFTDETGAAQIANSTVVMQGFVEGSNVNPADEMVKLINVVRAYETTQRIIQAQDELLSKAVNQVGSVK
jgi:flagellar basal-body rod protein FlgG